MSLSANNSTGSLFQNITTGDVNSQSAFYSQQQSQGEQYPLLDPILFQDLITQPTFNTLAVIPFLNNVTTQFPMEPGENWKKYCARMNSVDQQMAHYLNTTCVEYATIESKHISDLEQSKSSLLKEIAGKNITETDLKKMKELNTRSIESLQKLIAVKPVLVGFDLNVNSFFQFISHDTASIDQKIVATKEEDYAARFNLLILKSCVAQLTENDKKLLKDVAINLKMDDSTIDQLLIGSHGAENFVSISVIRNFVERNIESQQIIGCYEKFLESRTREDFLHLVSIYVTVESYGSEEQKKLVSKKQIRDLIIKTIDLDWEVRSILQQKQNDVDVLNLDGFYFYSVEDVNTYVRHISNTLLVGDYTKIIATCRAVFKFSENNNKEELIFKTYMDKTKRLWELDDLKISEDSDESPTIRKERNRIRAAPVLTSASLHGTKANRMSVWETHLKNLSPNSVEYVSNFLYNSTNLKMTFLVPIGEAAIEKQEALSLPKLDEMKHNAKKIPRMISVFSQMLSSLPFSDEITSKNIRGAIESIQTDFQLFGKNVQDMKDQTNKFTDSMNHMKDQIKEFTDSMNQIDGLQYFYVPPREWGKNLVLDLLENDYKVRIRNFISFKSLRETVKDKYVDNTITYTQAFHLVNLIETIELQEMLWSNEKKVSLSYDGVDSVQHFTRLWYKSFIIFIDAESSLIDLAQAQKDYYIAGKYFEINDGTEDTKQIKLLFEKLLDEITISEYDKRRALSTYRRLLVKAPISEERDIQLRKSFFQRPQEQFNKEIKKLEGDIYNIGLPRIRRIRASYYYISLVEETISNGIVLLNVEEYQTQLKNFTKIIQTNAKVYLRDTNKSDEILKFQTSIFKMGKYGSEPIMISLSLLFHEKYSIFPEERKDSYLKEFQSNLDICNSQFPASKDTDILKSMSFYLTQLDDKRITIAYVGECTEPTECIDSIFKLFKNPFYVSKFNVIDKSQATAIKEKDKPTFQDALSLAVHIFDDTSDASREKNIDFVLINRLPHDYRNYLTTSPFKTNTVHYANLYFYEPLRNNKGLYLVLLKELNKYVLGKGRFNELIDQEQQAATYLCDKDPECVSSDLLFALNYKLRQEYVTSELNPYYIIIPPKLVQIEDYTNSTPSTSSGFDKKNNDTSTDNETPDIKLQDESTREPIPPGTDVAFFNNKKYYFHLNYEYDPNSKPSSSTILQNNADILKLLDEAMDIPNPIQKKIYVDALWAKYKTHDFVRNILPMIRDNEEFSLLHNDIVSSTIQRLEFNFREWLIMSYSLQEEIGGYLSVLLDGNLRREDFTKNDELGKFIFDTTIGCLFQLRYLKLPEEYSQKNSKKNIRIPRISLILKQVLDNSPTLKGQYNTQDFESKSILNYLRHVFQGQLKKGFSLDDFTNECFSVTSLNNFFLKSSQPEVVSSVTIKGVEPRISDMLSNLINKKFFSGVYSVKDHYSAIRLQELIEIPSTINYDMKSMLSLNPTELDSYEKKLNFKSQLNVDLLNLLDASAKTIHDKNHNHIKTEFNKIELAKNITVLKDAIETQKVTTANLPIIFETNYTSVEELYIKNYIAAPPFFYKLQDDFKGTGFGGTKITTSFKNVLIDLIGEIEHLGSEMNPHYNFPDTLPESEFVTATAHLSALVNIKDKYTSTTASLDKLFIKLKEETNILITRPSVLPPYVTTLYDTIAKLNKELGLIDQLHLKNKESIGSLISGIKGYFQKTVNKNSDFFVSIDKRIEEINTARANQPVNAEANRQFDEELETLNAAVTHNKQILRNVLDHMSLTASVTPNMIIFSDSYDPDVDTPALNLFNLKRQQSVVLTLFTNFKGTKTEPINRYHEETVSRMNEKIQLFESQIQKLSRDIEQQVLESNEPIQAITRLMSNSPVIDMGNNITAVREVKKQLDQNIILIEGFQQIIDERSSSIVVVNGTAPSDKKIITLKSEEMVAYSSQISGKLIEVEVSVDKINSGNTELSYNAANSYLTELSKGFVTRVTSETKKSVVNDINLEFTSLRKAFEIQKDIELEFYNEMTTPNKRPFPNYANNVTKLDKLFDNVVQEAVDFNGKINDAIAATALYSRANSYMDPTSTNYIESKTLKGISALIQNLTGVSKSIMSSGFGQSDDDDYRRLNTRIADLDKTKQGLEENIEAIKINVTRSKDTIDGIVIEIKSSDLSEDEMEPALTRINTEISTYVELLTQFSTISGEEIYDRTDSVKRMIADALLVGPSVKLKFNQKKQTQATSETALKEKEILTFYEGVFKSIQEEVVSETELNEFSGKAKRYKELLDGQYKSEINVYTETDKTLVEQVNQKHLEFTSKKLAPTMSDVDETMAKLLASEGERNTKINSLESYIKDNVTPILQLSFFDLSLAKQYLVEATSQRDAILLLKSGVMKSPERQKEEETKLASLSSQLSSLRLCIDGQILVNANVSSVIAMLNEFDETIKTPSISEIDDLLQKTILSENFTDSHPEFKNIQTRVQGLTTKRDGLILEKQGIERRLEILKGTIQNLQSDFASAKKEENLDVMNTKIITISDNIESYKVELGKLDSVVGVFNSEKKSFLATTKMELNRSQTFTNSKNDQLSISERFEAARETTFAENEVIAYINSIDSHINNGTITEQQIREFRERSTNSNLFQRVNASIVKEKDVIRATKLSSEIDTEPKIVEVDQKFVSFLNKTQETNLKVVDSKLNAIIETDGEITKNTKIFEDYVAENITPLLKDDISIGNSSQATHFLLKAKSLFQDIKPPVISREPMSNPLGVFKTTITPFRTKIAKMLSDKEKIEFESKGQKMVARLLDDVKDELIGVKPEELDLSQTRQYLNIIGEAIMSIQTSGIITDYVSQEVDKLKIKKSQYSARVSELEGEKKALETNSSELRTTISSLQQTFDEFKTDAARKDIIMTTKDYNSNLEKQDQISGTSDNLAIISENNRKLEQNEIDYKDFAANERETDSRETSKTKQDCLTYLKSVESSIDEKTATAAQVGEYELKSGEFMTTLGTMFDTEIAHIETRPLLEDVENNIIATKNKQKVDDSSEVSTKKNEVSKKIAASQERDSATQQQINDFEVYFKGCPAIARELTDIIPIYQFHRDATQRLQKIVPFEIKESHPVFDVASYSRRLQINEAQIKMTKSNIFSALENKNEKFFSNSSLIALEDPGLFTSKFNILEKITTEEEKGKEPFLSFIRNNAILLETIKTKRDLLEKTIFKANSYMEKSNVVFDAFTPLVNQYNTTQNEDLVPTLGEKSLEFVRLADNAISGFYAANKINGTSSHEADIQLLESRKMMSAGFSMTATLELNTKQAQRVSEAHNETNSKYVKFDTYLSYLSTSISDESISQSDIDEWTPQLEKLKSDVIQAAKFESSLNPNAKPVEFSEAEKLVNKGMLQIITEESKRFQKIIQFETDIMFKIDRVTNNGIDKININKATSIYDGLLAEFQGLSSSKIVGVYNESYTEDFVNKYTTMLGNFKLLIDSRFKILTEQRDHTIKIKNNVTETLTQIKGDWMQYFVEKFKQVPDQATVSGKVKKIDQAKESLKRYTQQIEVLRNTYLGGNDPNGNIVTDFILDLRQQNTELKFLESKNHEEQQKIDKAAADIQTMAQQKLLDENELKLTTNLQYLGLEKKIEGPFTEDGSPPENLIFDLTGSVKKLDEFKSNVEQLRKITDENVDKYDTKIKELEESHKIRQDELDAFKTETEFFHTVAKQKINALVPTSSILSLFFDNANPEVVFDDVFYRDNSAKLVGSAELYFGYLSEAVKHEISFQSSGSPRITDLTVLLEESRVLLETNKASFLAQKEKYDSEQRLKERQTQDQEFERIENQISLFGVKSLLFGVSFKEENLEVKIKEIGIDQSEHLIVEVLSDLLNFNTSESEESLLKKVEGLREKAVLIEKKIQTLKSRRSTLTREFDENDKKIKTLMSDNILPEDAKNQELLNRIQNAIDIKTELDVIVPGKYTQDISALKKLQTIKSTDTQQRIELLRQQNVESQTRGIAVLKGIIGDLTTIMDLPRSAVNLGESEEKISQLDALAKKIEPATDEQRDEMEVINPDILKWRETMEAYKSDLDRFEKAQTTLIGLLDTPYEVDNLGYDALLQLKLNVTNEYELFTKSMLNQAHVINPTIDELYVNFIFNIEPRKVLIENAYEQFSSAKSAVDNLIQTLKPSVDNEINDQYFIDGDKTLKKVEEELLNDVKNSREFLVTTIGKENAVADKVLQDDSENKFIVSRLKEINAIKATRQSEREIYDKQIQSEIQKREKEEEISTVVSKLEYVLGISSPPYGKEISSPLDGENAIIILGNGIGLLSEMGANQTTISNFETQKSKFIEYVFNVNQAAKNATSEAKKNYVDKLDGLDNLKPKTLEDLEELKEIYIATSQRQNKIMKDSENSDVFLDEMDQKFEARQDMIHLREAEIQRLLEEEKQKAESEEAARQLAIQLAESEEAARQLEVQKAEADRLLVLAQQENARQEEANKQLALQKAEADRLLVLAQEEAARNLAAEQEAARKLEAEQEDARKLEAEQEAARKLAAEQEEARQLAVESWFENVKTNTTAKTKDIFDKSPAELDLLVIQIGNDFDNVVAVQLNDDDKIRLSQEKESILAPIIEQKAKLLAEEQQKEKDEIARQLAVNSWFENVKTNTTEKTNDISGKSLAELDSLIIDINALYSAVGNIPLNDDDNIRLSQEKDTILAPIIQQQATLIAQKEERERVLAEENRQAAVEGWFVGEQNRVADAIRDSPQTNLRELESLIGNIKGIFEDLGPVQFNPADKSRIEEEKKLRLAPILAEQERVVKLRNKLQNTDAPKLEQELMTLIYEPITEENLGRIQAKMAEFTNINQEINRLSGDTIVAATPLEVGSSAEYQFKQVLVGAKNEQFGKAVKHASEELDSLGTIEVETLEDLELLKTRVVAVKKSLEDETAALESYCDSSQRLFPETAAEIEKIKIQNKPLIANQYQTLAEYEELIKEMNVRLVLEKEALDAASSRTESAVLNFNTASGNVSAALDRKNFDELQGLAITSQEAYDSVTSAFNLERETITANTINTEQQKASLQALQEKETALSQSHGEQMIKCSLFITEHNREAAISEFTVTNKAITIELEKSNIDFNHIDGLKVQLTAQFKTAQSSIETEKSTVFLIPPTQAVFRDTLLNELTRKATQLKTLYQTQMRDCILAQVGSETNAVTLGYSETSQKVTEELAKTIIDSAKLDPLKVKLQSQFDDVLIAIATERKTIMDNTPDKTLLDQTLKVVKEKEDALKQSHTKQMRDCVLGEASSKTNVETSKYKTSFDDLYSALNKENLDLSVLDGLKIASQNAFDTTMLAMDTEKSTITTNIHDVKEQLKRAQLLDTKRDSIRTSHEKQLKNYNLRVSSFNTQSVILEYDETLQKIRVELAKGVIDSAVLNPLKEKLQQQYAAVLIAISIEKTTVKENTPNNTPLQIETLGVVQEKETTIMQTHVKQMSDCVISEATSKSATAILVFQDTVDSTNNYILMSDRIDLEELGRLNDLLQGQYKLALAAIESEKKTIISNQHSPEQLKAVNEKSDNLVRTNDDITANVLKNPKVLAIKAEIIFKSYNKSIKTKIESINEESLNVVQDMVTLETTMKEFVNFIDEIKSIYVDSKSGTPYDAYIAEQDIKLERLKNLIDERKAFLGKVNVTINTAEANARDAVASTQNSKIKQTPSENIRKIKEALLQLSLVLSSQEQILNPSDEVEQSRIKDIKRWHDEEKSKNDIFENQVNESIRQGHILDVHTEIRKEISEVTTSNLNLKDLVRVKESVAEKYDNLKSYIKSEEAATELARQKADDKLLTDHINIIEADIASLVTESKELNYNLEYDAFEDMFKTYNAVTGGTNLLLETAKELVSTTKKHIDLSNKINQKKGEIVNVDYLLVNLEGLIEDLNNLAEEERLQLEEQQQQKELKLEAEQLELSILRYQSNILIKDATRSTKEARDKANVFITSLNNMLPKEDITTTITDEAFDKAASFINLAEEAALAEISVMDKYGMNIEGFDRSAQVEVSSASAVFKMKQESRLKSIKSTLETRRNIEDMRQEALYEAAKRLTDSASYDVSYNIDEFKAEIDKLTFDTVGAAFNTWYSLVNERVKFYKGKLENVETKLKDELKILDKLEIKGKRKILTQRTNDMKTYQSDNLTKLNQIDGKMLFLKNEYQKHIEGKSKEQLLNFYILSLKTSQTTLKILLTEMEAEISSDKFVVTDKIASDIKTANYYVSFIWTLCNTKGVLTYKDDLKQTQETVMGYRNRLNNIIVNVNEISAKKKEAINNEIVQNEDKIAQLKELINVAKIFNNYEAAARYQNEMDFLVFENVVLADKKAASEEIIVKINKDTADAKEALNEKLLGDDTWFLRMLVSWVELLYEFLQNRMRYGIYFPEVLECFSVFFEGFPRMPLADNLFLLVNNLERIGGGLLKYNYSKLHAYFMVVFDGVGLPLTLLFSLMYAVKKLWPFGTKRVPVSEPLTTSTTSDELPGSGSETKTTTIDGSKTTTSDEGLPGSGSETTTSDEGLPGSGSKTTTSDEGLPGSGSETTTSDEGLSGSETTTSDEGLSGSKTTTSTEPPALGNSEGTKSSGLGDTSSKVPSGAFEKTVTDACSIYDEMFSSEDFMPGGIYPKVLSKAPAVRSTVTENAETEEDVCLKYEKMFSEEEFLRGGSAPYDNYEALFLEDDIHLPNNNNYDKLFEEDIQVGGVNPIGTSSNLGQSGFSMGFNASQIYGISQENPSGYVKPPDSIKDTLGENPLKNTDFTQSSADPTSSKFTGSFSGLGYNPAKWGTMSGYYEADDVIWLDGPPVKKVSPFSSPDLLLDSFNGDIPEMTTSTTIRPPVFQDDKVDSTGRIVKVFTTLVDYVNSLYPETEEDKNARLSREAVLAELQQHRTKNTRTLRGNVRTYRAKSLQEKLEELASKRAEASRQGYEAAKANIVQDDKEISTLNQNNKELQQQQSRLELQQEQSLLEGEDISSSFAVPLKQIAEAIEENDFQIRQAGIRILANRIIISGYEALLQETPQQKAERLANEAKDDMKTVETNDQNNIQTEVELNREDWNDWYESFYSGYRFLPTNFLFAQNQIGQAEFGPHVNEKYSWIRLEKQKYYEEVTSKFLPSLTTVKKDNNLGTITGLNLNIKEVLSDGRCFSGSALYLFKLNEKNSEENRRREANENWVFFPNYNVDFHPTEQGNGHSEELNNWISDNIIEPIESKRKNDSDTDLVNFVYAYNFINGKKKDDWNNDVDKVFRTVDRNLIIVALDQLFLNEKIRDLLYKLDHFFDKGEAFSFSNLFTEPESMDMDYLALLGPGETLPEEMKFDFDKNKELLDLLGIIKNKRESDEGSPEAKEEEETIFDKELLDLLGVSKIKISKEDYLELLGPDKESTVDRVKEFLVSKINFERLNTELVEICRTVKNDPRFDEYYDKYIDYIKSLNQVLKKGDPYIPTTASSRALDTFGKALKNWRDFLKVPSDEKKRVYDSYPWTEPDVGPAQVLADQYKTNIIIRSESNYNKLNKVYNPRDEHNKFYEAPTTIYLLFMNMNGASHYVSLIDPEFHQEIRMPTTKNYSTSDLLVTPVVEEEKSTFPPNDYTILEINIGGKIVKDGHKGKIDEWDGLFVEMDSSGKQVLEKEETKDFVEVNPDGTIMRENGIVIKHGKIGKVDEKGIFREIPPPVTGWTGYLFTPKVHLFVEVFPENTFLEEGMSIINGELQENTYDYFSNGPNTYKKHLKTSARNVNPKIDNKRYFKLYNMSEEEIETSKRKENVAVGFKSIEGPRKAIIRGKSCIYDYKTSQYITTDYEPVYDNNRYENLLATYTKGPEKYINYIKPIILDGRESIFDVEKNKYVTKTPKSERIMSGGGDESEPTMKDYTELFEMEPEPVITDYTELFETEPEPVITDYTELFETEPEPVITDYTELFETEPEPVIMDYTELFETEPVITDYTALFEMDFR